MGLLSFLGNKNDNVFDIPCTHEWGLVTKTYGPPRHDLPQGIEKLDPSILQKVMFGVTTYYFECQHCKERRVEEMLGSDESELAALIRKIEATGEMQYVNMNGNSYAMAKVPPQIQVPSSAVPVK